MSESVSESEGLSEVRTLSVSESVSESEVKTLSVSESVSESEVLTFSFLYFYILNEYVDRFPWTMTVFNII